MMIHKSDELSDQLYNPINHLTQTELMEKFNLAFYEAQALSKSDVISTFNETIDDTVNETEIDNPREDYRIDYLISNSPLSTPNSDVDINYHFDFSDFVIDFDENVSGSQEQLNANDDTFDTETYTTESSYENSEKSYIEDFSTFFVAPPFHRNDTIKGLDVNGVHLYDGLTTGSLDLDDLPTDFHELEEAVCDYDEDNKNILPPVGTIIKSNIDFNNFLRNVPADEMSYSAQEPFPKNEFGHLIGTKCVNNNFVVNNPALNIAEEQSANIFDCSEANRMVLTQHEALLNDDPLLSSSNVIFPARLRREYAPKVYKCEYNTDGEEVTSSTNLMCKWDDCFEMYESQTSLVKHIEKCHVELKRGDEFTCFWENCPRKTKPFNARYKLLIHMRVHSGEKPNKCPFKGCNKAFSRLENLKIHQRSHTGERPYLCQFSSCTKSFSNSSDRAKHQRTHFDTKPYACQVMGCSKKYTDPSSLRKHVKNHTFDEQMQVKKKSSEETGNLVNQSIMAKRYLDPNKQRAVRGNHIFSTNYEHSYSNSFLVERAYGSMSIKQDLKNKLSEKSKLKKYVVD